MEKLRADLDNLIEKLEHSEDFKVSLENLVSVYPFNEYEYIISHLLAATKLTLDEYYGLRDSYIERNLYLYVFEISAPRGLGDKWAYGQLKHIVPEFKKPNKNLDSEYSNQYDLWLDWVDRKNKPHGIRIEIKTSRAVDFEKPDEPLYIKALASDSERPFDMNFQQIKPRCADVFLWIGVWRDIIRYWVLTRDEIQNNKYFSKGQHRGNIGEGQLHLKDDNISEFKQYEILPTDIKEAVIRAYKRQNKIT
ncbi:MAG: hypothetical protein ABIL62_01145 [Planctomycetota bacterium]